MTSIPIVAQETTFDLRIYLVQPLLSAIGSLLVQLQDRLTSGIELVAVVLPRRRAREVNYLGTHGLAPFPIGDLYYNLFFVSGTCPYLWIDVDKFLDRRSGSLIPRLQQKSPDQGVRSDRGLPERE
jgi:hypothetical protein